MTPVFLNSTGQSTEEVCRDFAIMLADDGRTSHLVFRDPAGGPPATAPANASDGAEVTGTHHLAEALGQVADGVLSPGSVGTDWAASQVRKDGRPIGGDGTGPLPAAAYGSALSLERPEDPRRTAMTEAAQRIGVNEFAWADVGEAYLVQSVAAPGEHGPSLETNYAKPSTESGESYFGYHFITVVLASEDGTHQVSLENHARAGSREERLRRMVLSNLRAHDVAELREQADTLRREIARQEDAGVDEGLKEVRGHLDLTILLTRAALAQQEVASTAAGSPERNEARRTFDGVVRTASKHLERLEKTVPGKQLWYMRMFSRRPGESAHDVNARLLEDGAAEANPLTTVILHGQEERTQTVHFDPDAEQAPAAAASTIRHVAARVARTGLWNAAHDLPLPQVTMAGGRTSRLSRDIGRVRANAVAAAFRRELADALHRLQDGTPGPHLDADRFLVEATSVRVEKARADRVATVEITVDDRRGGPRQIALRGLRGGSPDDGRDPLAEQWPIGRPVTLMRPGSAVWRRRRPSPPACRPTAPRPPARARSRSPARTAGSPTPGHHIPDGAAALRGGGLRPPPAPRRPRGPAHGVDALRRRLRPPRDRGAPAGRQRLARPGRQPRQPPSGARRTRPGRRAVPDHGRRHAPPPGPGERRSRPEHPAGPGPGGRRARRPRATGPTARTAPSTADPSADVAPPGGRTAPPASDAESAAARTAYDQAREVFRAAAGTTGPDRTAPAGRSAIDDARALVERAEERLWALGAAPETLADGRTPPPRHRVTPTRPANRPPPFPWRPSTGHGSWTR
ncbi:hypothetical protein HFP43_07730 [Streptomyces sp. SJ1-7]|nr:hypothetical protein [Streptomyces sp. SJ1-7]